MKQTNSVRPILPLQKHKLLVTLIARYMRSFICIMFQAQQKKKNDSHKHMWPALGVCG